MNDRAGINEIERDIEDLHRLGYQQKLRRTIGAYTSFAVGFAMVSITTAIFTVFSDPFNRVGGAAMWLWVPVTIGILAITLVYCHLSARLPVTGYAYQWSGRLVNRDFGWFTGWMALLAFTAGTAGIAVAIGSVFGPIFIDDPSRRQIQLLAAVMIVGAVLVNAIGVRAATWVNNVGATAELIGTLGLAAIVLIALPFLDHKEGPKVLWDTGPVGGGNITWVAVGLATLLPVYTLIGWEGSADLAEETRDPRRTAPKAMLRAVLVSAVGGFAIFAIFSMAIPHGINETFNRSDSPLLHVFRTQFGSFTVHFVEVIAFIAMSSVILANVAVATRLIYSLSRDRMLPGWQVLERVNPRTRTPLYVIALVGIIALVINYLSAGIIARVVAIVAVCYYGTYLLTLVATLWGDRKGTIPEGPPGTMNLGKWLRPLSWFGIAFTLVIAGFMTLPKVNHVAGKYTLYALVLGAIWYIVYLRRKIASGEAGVHTTPLAVEESGEEERIAKESATPRLEPG
jgi:amino acid transporter